MTGQERQDAEDLLRLLRSRRAQADQTIQGLNVGLNCGETAGQTVPHAHIHLIPRRKGDTSRPRGRAGRRSGADGLLRSAGCFKV
jgi:ATP adenylyltransferase